VDSILVAEEVEPVMEKEILAIIGKYNLNKSNLTFILENGLFRVKQDDRPITQFLKGAIQCSPHLISTLH
ncbi:unnamed protein product, partial [marine sediment metagenome]